jgi:hypothetical protein
MNRDILKILYRNSNILKKISLKFLLNMKGGGNRKLKVEYNNHTYVFEENEINDNYYTLSSIEGDGLDCVVVLISTEDNIAEIHSITNSKSCMANTNENIGSHLLKLTIKMIKKYASKYNQKVNINKISLGDMSIKKCGSHYIKLTKMLILLTGHTWYGKYDFRPRDNITNNIDKYQNKKYENNVKIMDTLTISDINLIKYIKMTKNNNFIDKTKDTIIKKPKMLLKDFLRKFLKDYDNMCEYFYIFYEQLYNDIGLTDFQGGSFVLLL